MTTSPSPVVVLDRSLCTGHGLCYATAPEAFEPDDRGYGVVTARAAETDAAELDAAASGCPEQAITIRMENPA